MATPDEPKAAPTPTEVDQDETSEEKRECPICKLMREGGCEPEFQAFMDCGAAAEKGDTDYEECIKGFEAMRQCMEKNPEVFGPLLKDVNKDEAPEDAAAAKDAGAKLESSDK